MVKLISLEYKIYLVGHSTCCLKYICVCIIINKCVCKCEVFFSKGVGVGLLGPCL